ncbi:cadherin domain-containing protein [Microvirga sp. 2MCAF38]|uniref:cadherin domain-containing protein n=1 Tax=Microvirga sp. 2MCAF38 TaxID=3232989 RepID=UPI003F9A8CAB
MANMLNGAIGNDHLSGLGGDDILVGELGNDILEGGLGTDHLLGGDGYDLLEGGAGADTLDGGAHDDLASYSSSTIGLTVSLSFPNNNTGDAQGDIYLSIEGLVGSRFNDRLEGDAGANNLQGWYGDDLLSGGGGNDTLFGGEGNDTLSGDQNGQTGDDVMQGEAGNDTLSGGEGTDTAVYRGKFSEYKLDERAAKLGIYGVIDLVADRDGTDAVYDSVELLRFSDITYRLKNHDPTDIKLSETRFSEDALASTILASLSAVDADGDAITYSLVSTDGPFKIDGRNLVLTGQLDFETKAQYSITVKASNGYGAGTTQTFALTVLDVVEGNDPNDPNNPNLPLTLWGTSRADVLEGRNANDVLYGQGGNDVLRGNLGNDKLYGRAGKDVLTGGLGSDIFVFDTKLSSSPKVNKANLDRITDFSVKDDTIHLAKSVFKKMAKKGVIKSSEFYQGTKAHDASDHIIYNKKTGALYYDPDGTGAAAQIQIAILSKNLKMTYKDFFVI